MSGFLYVFSIPRDLCLKTKKVITFSIVNKKKLYFALISKIKKKLRQNKDNVNLFQIEINYYSMTMLHEHESDEKEKHILTARYIYLLLQSMFSLDITYYSNSSVINNISFESKLFGRTV